MEIKSINFFTFEVKYYPEIFINIQFEIEKV